jgi:putative membrane protein
MLSTIVNALRGALIGVAEVIPGVSGGTVALIVGIYETLIDAIADTVLAARRALGLTSEGRSVRRAGATIRALPWAMLVPVGLGMVIALLLGARFIEPLLEEQPVAMRALFLGLVLAGTYVPAHMVLRTEPGRWRASEVLIVLAVAAVTFVLMGLPPGDIADPGPVAIVASAAMAICALVLPGVSGSFLLLTIGMYEPTIAAVNDLDFAYIALFALGAIIGLSAFVSVLRWLLENRARITLVVIVGLMLGSLRALWPWQGDDRELLAPTSQVGLAIALFLAGVAVVAILIVVERRFGVSEEQVDFPDQDGAPQDGVPDQDRPRSASE